MLVLKNNEIAQRHMALNMHRFSIRLNRHARFGIRRINNCHFYGLRCRPSFDDHKSGQVRIFQKRRGLATWRVRIARVSVVRVRVVIILPTSKPSAKRSSFRGWGKKPEHHRPEIGNKAVQPAHGLAHARRAYWAAVYPNKDFVEGFASKFRPLLMTQEVKLLQAAPWGPHP
jgi:hypothetical protein